MPSASTSKNFEMEDNSEKQTADNSVKVRSVKVSRISSFYGYFSIVSSNTVAPLDRPHPEFGSRMNNNMGSFNKYVDINLPFFDHLLCRLY